MNPPSAIHGSMGRERKPFTYTPGGLDLSEIKSERMAKRLMRNAMNQGVPEQPQTIQSPPTSGHIAVPNFNCLPVQVFPAFQLPANPKSLLRTRSTPEQNREQAMQRVPPPSQGVNNFKPSGIENIKETVNNNPQVNNNNRSNNKSMSLYEFSNSSNDNNFTRTSYGSDTCTVPIFPEMSYDAQYFEAVPRNDKKENTFCAPLSNENDNKSPMKESLDFATPDITIKLLSDTNVVQEPVAITKTVEDNAGTDDNDDDEQREVKVVKKVVKKEKKVESQNGDQNGDAKSDAEMTVKLPAKKSAAKSETKVEVVKKTLPDGSVEEVKTTITKTTIDGKTEITTKTETQIIPKEEEEEEEIVEEEDEEEDEVVVQEVEENGEEEVEEEPVNVVVKKTVQETPAAKETSKKDLVVKKEESSETTTTKKVVVVQKSNKEEQEVEEEEEEEEEEVEEPEPVVVKKPIEKPAQIKEVEQKEVVEIKEEVKNQQVIENDETQKEVEDEEEEIEEEVEVEKKEVKAGPPKNEEPEEEEEVEEEEEFEEAEETVTIEKPKETVEKQSEPAVESKEQKDDEESEYTEEEIESEKEELPKEAPAQETPKVEPEKEVPKQEEKPEPAISEPRVPLREPSIPLEKVEEVEIKPIGSVNETVSKTHTESTEILSNVNQPPAGTLSTQTEYNRIENIVTVNRTTKTLDHSYEQLTQQGIPTVKTYFAPERERVGTSPQPSKPYQPSAYTAQPQTERRHSLLLERLSMERQMPTTDIYQNNYQYNNQSLDQQRQWSQEPQSEVINVSNVKPSTITNQQWYQQTRKENVIYNNVTPATPAAPPQQWSQPQQQPQPQYQTQSQAQPQYQPQPQYQTQPQAQPQYQPQLQSQFQTSFTENTLQDSSKLTSTSNSYQQSSYSSYAPKPNNWASPNLGRTFPSVNASSDQYSFQNKDSSENYQSTQQYSSSYVPPPWEQDPSYVAPEIPTQNYYQTPPPANTFSPSSKPGWKPTPPQAKFTKPAPTAYVPPAPNQSFVKHVNTSAEPPKLQGRKTYYSEYERRYITVPDSTYIPSETKLQPQPDPSPQYYYDNNEPNETVEHQWRKELREFTEKTSQTQEQTELTSVKPPWEEDTKYAKVPTVTYTPTPSWSQTLRPQSWRERSFESEYVGSQEWSKTNTLGRGRPLSSYGNVEATIPERPARGVSVDRYNPNNYQSPITSEHGPVQSHTLTATPHMKGYHNPNVPAYHARASAEPREQPIPNQQSRQYRESRASPIQSRSFKYLQWMTGTEN